MDPITATIIEYDNYLRSGGEPVYLAGAGFNSTSQRVCQRKLHPSGLGPGLCDRKAAYDIMVDIGEIEVEEFPPETYLDFRIGYVFQDFIAQALAWCGALVDMEQKGENNEWTWRIDLVVAPDKLVYGAPVYNEDLWIVDVKTVKGQGLFERYPKPYHVAQVTKYTDLLLETLTTTDEYVPVLYYVARTSFESALYWWDITDTGDCEIYRWKHEWRDTWPNFRNEMHQSEQHLLDWLRHDVMPPRCGKTPDEHPFMCVEKDYKKKLATPKCRYFERCWGRPPNQFILNHWDDDDYLPF